ncbi:MAG: AI-2E family transporter [Loktanella sp.]|nr:AI-2E family transporter [Loktanella sp.]
MEQRRWIRTETVLLTAGLLFISYLLGNVLLLIFAAIILAIGCDGAAKAVMRRTGASHGWALAGVGIALFGIIAAAIGLTTTRLAQQFQELVQTVIAAADRLQNWLQDIGVLDLVDTIDGSSDSLTGAAGNIMGQMMTMGMSVVGAMTSLLFLIVLAFFLSADPGLYRRGVLRLVPPGGRAVVADTFTAIAHAVRWWFLGQLVSMAFLGTTVGLGLFVMGVDLWFALAVLTALVTFVPFIGPLIATVPIVAVSFAESTQTGLIVLAGYIVIENIEGNVVTPMIQQRAVNLPPALLIGLQVLLGVVFGAIGLILAAPFTVMAMVAVQKLWVEHTLGEKVT